MVTTDPSRNAIPDAKIVARRIKIACVDERLATLSRDITRLSDPQVPSGDAREQMENLILQDVSGLELSSTRLV